MCVAVQARVEKLWANSRHGEIDFNEHLRHTKQFRNPEILQKLGRTPRATCALMICAVEQREILAHGTNYPESLFSPNCDDESCFYDAIYKQQNLMLSKKAAAKEAAKSQKPVVTRVVGDTLVLSELCRC